MILKSTRLSKTIVGNVAAGQEDTIQNDFRLRIGGRSLSGSGASLVV
jgi:hypothetical protein